LTLKELEIFYALCEETHMQNVAKKLQLSQSAISLAIKSLENKLDVKLFDRIGKKLILNERGREFKSSTQKHFFALQDAKNHFKEDKLSGVLKVASSKTIGNFITSNAILDYMIKYPNIKVFHKLLNSNEILKSLKDGEIDIGFIETECIDDRLEKKIVAKDRLIVVSSDLSIDNEVYIDELKFKRWVLREKGSGTREIFLNSLGECKKEVEIFMEYSEFSQIKQLLKKDSNIITCISKIAVEEELKKGDLQEIKIKNFEFLRNFYLIYHQDKYKSKIFESFCRFIKRYF